MMRPRTEQEPWRGVVSYCDLDWAGDTVKFT